LAPELISKKSKTYYVEILWTRWTTVQ